MSEPTSAVEQNVEPQLHVETYEALWIRIALVIMVVFILAIITASVAFNIQVPGVIGRINPNALDAPNSPFANPGLRELAPGKYEAYIVAQAWVFNPSPLNVPVGSEVTFYITSRDIQHGFKLVDTNVNLMALPGQVSSLRAKFDTPGTYNFICHEYCGLAHHMMFGQLIVEGAAEETVSQP